MSYHLTLTARRAAERLRAYARDAARPLDHDEDPQHILDRIAINLNALAVELEQALAPVERARRNTEDRP